MASIYIHIPFCRSICAYCDFTKVLYNRELAIEYLEKLAMEVEDLYDHEKVETLYIGGGTPSILSDYERERLKEIVKTFAFAEDYEFTFECNIEDIDKSLLFDLLEMGVNRLSLGVESFDGDKLVFMNREADYRDVEEKMKMIREAGFKNVSLDLMYGIPYERLKDLRKDLNLFLKLKPDHISAYSLQIEDHTLCKWREDENIREEEEAKMFNYIVAHLEKAGYSHYEVSNFAKPGFASRHNLTYWNNEEYYGFGLGASGFIKGFRYENTKNFDDYLLGNFKSDEHLVSPQEMMENEVMLGLRKKEGINLQQFFDKYEVNLQDVFPIKPLIRSKELIYKDGYIFINPKYIYVMNEILLKLI